MPLVWNGSFCRLFMIRSVFSLKPISCWPCRRIFFSPRMRSSAAGMMSGSILFGQWPSSPISTALSVPWPRPVRASEPNTSARMRATSCRRPASARWCSTKRAAARIGPTVCEELGPMPIL
jgi:hypothetical protein